MRIKWIRLKEICERIVNKQVNLHGSTEMNSNVKAFVAQKNNRIDILINFHYIKSEEEVMRAIAHELVHVLKQTSEHGQDFDKEWQKLYERIKEQYEKEVK